ncbi:MAG: HAD family hydrolase, partial [Gammaproteobacteria bacterium]
MTKKAIMTFVEKVTKPGLPDFVPEPERIAVFDNDGTLWPENPIPFQFAFAVDSLQRAIADKPVLNDDPFVKTALQGDAATLLANNAKGLFHVIGLTHAGMTTDEFARRVDEWIKSAKHPRFDRPYDECIYQPMRELLAYLRANGFKTFIVSGGGADFMRVWSERVYGIPPENVVGSHGEVTFELRDDGPVLVKSLEHVFVDDKAGKPAGIHRFIGRRPMMAFGNSDGDKAMLEYTTIDNPRPSFGLIVHHTDSEREYAYDANPKSSGKLVEALADAPKRGWTVVNMKDDWHTVLSDNSVIAIDILLEPDQVMLDRSAEVNARLLKVFPTGFSLDATHRPHITLIQRFVRTADLDKMYAAAGEVLSRVDLRAMQLEAYKHYFIPAGDNGLAGIVVKPTPELTKLQSDLLDAVKPFTVETGGSSAFVTTPDDLVMNPALITYVEAFDKQAAGKKFNPHVTTGVAPREYLDKMLKEPFATFPFSPVR